MLKKLTVEQQKFAAENHKLIYAFLLKKGFSQDEYYGVAAVGFCKAVRAYDKDKGVKFSIFAFACMQNEVFMSMREYKYKKNFSHVSLEDITHDNLTYADFIPSNLNIEEDAETKIIFQQFFSKLSEREKTILILLSKGAKQKEIGLKIGLSQSYVARLIEKIKNKLAA